MKFMKTSLLILGTVCLSHSSLADIIPCPKPEEITWTFVLEPDNYDGEAAAAPHTDLWRGVGVNVSNLKLIKFPRVEKEEFSYILSCSYRDSPGGDSASKGYLKTRTKADFYTSCQVREDNASFDCTK